MTDPIAHFSQFDGGLNTKQRANKIAANQMASIVSMDFVANSMARSKGYVQLGTEDDTDLTGKTIYTHTILAGQEVLVKTIGTFIKFLDTVDNKWYKTTASTFTTGLHWSFFTFNGYLYGQNGTDNWVIWKGGGHSTVDGVVSIGATTIDVATGTGGRFDASGTVMIQDQQITYSGKTGDQLTGVSGVVTEIPDGSTIIQELDASTYSGLAQADQIVFFKNRSFMIDADTPTIIRHSKLADNTNPETDLVNYTIAGSGAGDAGFGIAPEQITNLRVLINGNASSVLAAFCQDGNVYAFEVTDSGSTTTNVFIPLRTTTTYPPNARMSEIVENDIAFVDNLGHVRTLFYGDVNTPVQVQTISSQIEPSLEITNFSSDGQMAYDKRILYVLGKTSLAVTPDIVFYRDSNYNAWGSIGHWDVIDMVRYNNTLVGLSSISGKVWTLNSGYNADGNTYYSEAVTGDVDFQFPVSYKSLLNLRATGFITTNCQAYIDVFKDNNETPDTFLISGNNTDIVDAETGVAIGTVVFGRGVFGGGLPGGVERREFVAILQPNNSDVFLKMALRFRIDDKDVDFEVNDVILYGRKEGENLVLESRILNQS